MSSALLTSWYILTASYSTDALWFLTRQYTSHMVKRRGAGVPTLSTEAGNLKGVHSYKYSGLIHPKIFTVSPNANGKGVSIISRRSKGGKSQVKGAANRVSWQPSELSTSPCSCSDSVTSRLAAALVEPTKCAHSPSLAGGGFGDDSAAQRRWRRQELPTGPPSGALAFTGLSRL